MKLLSESTSCLLFLFLLVELPVLAMSHPAPGRNHKDVLTMLFQKMRQLNIVVQGVTHHFDNSLPSKHNLTSLPSLHFSRKDLVAEKANSTINQLSSGLHLYKLHFDWLLYWYNQSGLASNQIKEISEEIQSIIMLVQRQTDTPAQNTSLSLPTLTSAWEIYGTSAVIHKKLLVFSDLYIRALWVLKSYAKTEAMRTTEDTCKLNEDRFSTVRMLDSGQLFLPLLIFLFTLSIYIFVCFGTCVFNIYVYLLKNFEK
ncbi:uncharacterized protein LOC124382200 isoform X2 [Silurus meridionalis]|uniref:uncharacterized protein LOC124382200 isoform X2 n=1 Tax=Silurus meridionalis TaxID=175797 RepID=UPI001EE9BE60|nr:uncharacterized protein LOC124382200 isoform X2 [Silurus meridionalis]